MDKHHVKHGQHAGEDEYHRDKSQHAPSGFPVGIAHVSQTVLLPVATP
jgi:hypothetical protein